MAEKVILELDAKTDKALKAIEALMKRIEELEEEVAEGNEEQVKSNEKLAKSFKGVGLAMKAAGFGLVMKIVDKLTQTLMQNQTVADAVNTVFTAIGLVFSKVAGAMVDAFNKVSDATGGFDALQKVLGGALTVAMNSIVIIIQGLVLGVKKAQLAWEQSFFGDKDPATIKKLQGEIEEVGNKIDATAEKIKGGGKQIADNFVEAVGEVGQLATGIAEGVSDAIEKIDIKTELSNAKRLVQNKNNYALLEAQSQRLIEKYDLEAETQRQLRDDDRKSVEERIAANNKLKDILDKQSKEEKNQIEIRKQAIQEQIDLEGKLPELKAELYNLNTELLAIDAKVAGFKSEQLTNEASLQKENIELVNAKKESENQLSIERQRFNAEQIQDELLRLQELKKIDEEETITETARLQAIVNNANAGTQAKVDAQIALDEFLEQSRQTNITRDAEIVAKEIELEKRKTEAKLKALSDLEMIFGAESAMGRAALIGKQLLAARELLIDLGVIKSKASKAIATANLDAASSGSAVSSGFAQTLKLGFPAAIPALIGYAASAVGIISSVLAATKKTKSVASSVGGSGGGDVSISQPQTNASQPPAFNVVGASNTNQLADAIGGQSQQPVKAYVVSNDVTTAQSMDRNIVSGASI